MGRAATLIPSSMEAATVKSDVNKNSQAVILAAFCTSFFFFHFALLFLVEYQPPAQTLQDAVTDGVRLASGSWGGGVGLCWGMGPQGVSTKVSGGG